MLKLIAGASLTLLLSACSISNLPSWSGVYNMPVEQGNHLTQTDIDKIKVGQTQTQVRFLLGTPLLNDPFHADRWDYVYYQHQLDGKSEAKALTLQFKDGILVSRSPQ